MSSTVLPPGPSHSTGGAVFERLLSELVMAWKKLSTYPSGHPLREGAVASAYRELKSLLDLGKPVDLGVGKDGLSWGEQRSSSEGSRQLAQLLYQNNVAVLRFVAGLSEAELEAALGVLRGAPGEGGLEALHHRLTAAAVLHVELKRADFSLVRSTLGLAGGERPPGDLWDRILRWQLEGRPDHNTLGHGLAAVMSWVGSTLGDAPDLASPQARRLLSQLVEAVEAELAVSGGVGAGQRVRQVAELLGALPTGLSDAVFEAALGQLMKAEGRGPELAALAGAVPRGRLLGAFGRLAASGAHFPPLVGRLIDQLAPETEAAAPHASQAAAVPADRDLEILRRRPGAFLELPPVLAPAAAEAFSAEVQTLEPGATLQRLVGMLLRLTAASRSEGEIDGLITRLEHAYATFLAGGQAGAAYVLVLELADLSEQGAGTAARKALARLGEERAAAMLAGTIRRAPASELEDLHRLVARLGAEPIRHLLLALGETEDRSLRRVLFNFLRRHADKVVEVAPSVLSDERWFVVRNVLSLLQDVGDERAVASAQSCLGHPDARVRMEALKLVGRHGTTDLGEEVLGMLRDPDERISRQALQLAGALKLRPAVPMLLELLRPLDLAGKQRELRLRVLKSLGEIGDPAALEELKRFFTGVPPFVSAEEKRAAFLSLGGYPVAERAAWVERGARSRDAEIQASCQALLASPGRGPDG